jgi:hypothetical protein
MSRVNDGRCCFCGADYGQWGNNPEPVMPYESNRACNACNDKIVIPVRLGKWIPPVEDDS